MLLYGRQRTTRKTFPIFLNDGFERQTHKIQTAVNHKSDMRTYFKNLVYRIINLRAWRSADSNRAVSSQCHGRLIQDGDFSSHASTELSRFSERLSFAPWKLASRLSPSSPSQRPRGPEPSPRRFGHTPRRWLLQELAQPKPSRPEPVGSGHRVVCLNGPECSHRADATSVASMVRGFILRRAV